jgi:hypothetical protein
MQVLEPRTYSLTHSRGDRQEEFVHRLLVFFTFLNAGPRRHLRLELSDPHVYEP